MMLTVSTMSAIFIKTWKTLEVSEALNRLPKINAQSHSVYAPPPPGLGVEITCVLIKLRGLDLVKFHKIHPHSFYQWAP